MSSQQTATTWLWARLSPSRAPLALHGDAPINVVVDYRVHYVGAQGIKNPKVFKLARRRLVPGQAARLGKTHRSEDVSIRRIHPGPHVIDLQINGRILGSLGVDVAAGA